MPVVGAWQWLPQYGFDIATEMERAEAYRPMSLEQCAASGSWTLRDAEAWWRIHLPIGRLAASATSSQSVDATIT